MAEIQAQSPLKRIPKDEYAQSLGISLQTLGKMLNTEFFIELQKVGYKKTQKYLTNAQKEKLEDLAININLKDE